MTEINARSVALDCLMQILEDGAFSHTVLNAAREKYAWLPKEERSFITRLVHGTVEYELQLDRILNRYSSVKVKKMKPVIRNILRMTLYQLLYMDRVPQHAAANEAVNLTVRRGLRGLKGFVNAVSRKLAADREKIREELLSANDLSLKYSVPEWLAGHFCKAYGKEKAERILNAFLSKETMTVRIAGNKLPEELAEEITESPWCPGLYCLKDADALERLKNHAEVQFYVQDLSSALSVRAAQPKPGDNVIDLCAAPGGKSIAASILMDGKGSVRAFDLTEAKTALMRDNFERTGISILHAETGDASVFQEQLEESADLVIADLPCSGLGVIGRKPDIKRNITPNGMHSLAELQRKILLNAGRYVKPGGRLLFSTCTVNHEENEANREAFLEAFKEFAPADLTRVLPELSGVEGAETLKSGWIQILPCALPADGFFFALFERKAEKKE